MKTRRRRGGKFIYQGSYGCAFSPAIKCKGNSRRANGKVSKLMDTYAAEEEFEIHDLIVPLDPEEKFFLVPSRMCSPEVEVNPENEYDKCTLINLNNKYIQPKLLLLTQGGQDLTQLKVTSSAEIHALIRGFASLFEGLALLHANNIVHHDIKPANIVALKEDDSYRLRYIDFGLAQKISEFSASTELYAFWSFELRILANPAEVAAMSKENTVALIESWYEIQKYGGDLFPYWMLLNTVAGPSYTYKNVKDIAQGLLGEANYGDLIQASDIFALGRSLSMVYSQATQHVSRAKDIVDMGANPELKEASGRFFALMYKMLDPNPYGRPSASACLAEFKDVLSAL